MENWPHQSDRYSKDYFEGYMLFNDCGEFSDEFGIMTNRQAALVEHRAFEETLGETLILRKVIVHLAQEIRPVEGECQFLGH